MAASAGLAEASITRLASPTATGAQASSSSTSPCDGLVQLLGRRHPVGEADPLGLLAADQLAGHHQLLGAAEADHRRQPRRAADVRDQADPRLGHADQRVGGDHAQVARQRELHGAADAGAVDHADRRLGHLLGEVPGVEAGAAERAQVLGRLGQGGQRAEVHAGGEHRAGAADHDAAHRRFGGRLAQRLAGRDHQLAVERVALLRPVQHDVADGSVVFGQHEGHASATLRG